MFCMECGGALDAGARFCSRCGTKVAPQVVADASPGVSDDSAAPPAPALPVDAPAPESAGPSRALRNSVVLVSVLLLLVAIVTLFAQRSPQDDSLWTTAVRLATGEPHKLDPVYLPAPPAYPSLRDCEVRAQRLLPEKCAIRAGLDPRGPYAPNVIEILDNAHYDVRVSAEGEKCFAHISMESTGRIPYRTTFRCEIDDAVLQ